jgi:predicted nucleic acid-binding protein
MLFFDAYAIIEVINGNPKYERYKSLILLTNTLHLSEVVYSLIKKVDIETVRKVIESLDFEFIDMSDEIAIQAAIFKLKNKHKQMSYADCIGYITAKINNWKFLTGDKEFEGLEDVEFVRK